MKVLLFGVFLSLFFFSVGQVRAEEPLDVGLDLNDTNVEESVSVIDKPVGQDSEISDFDGDTVIDSLDNCAKVYNKDQLDSDQDGIGDTCDEAPYPDRDKDSIPDEADNCIAVYNPLQEDENKNEVGDLCEGNFSDIDKDGVRDELDNCPYAYNPLQEDKDKDFRGDVCQKQVYIPEKNEPSLDLKFTQEPKAEFKAGEVEITYKTNYATEAAIRYGFSREKLTKYASSLSSDVDHSFKIKIPSSAEKELYYSVVAVSSAAKIESEILKVQLDSAKQSSELAEQENKRNQLTKDLEKIKSFHEKNGLLYQKIAEESLSLQEKIKKTLYVICTIVLGIFVLMDEKHVLILFKDLKEAIKVKNKL